MDNYYLQVLLLTSTIEITRIVFKTDSLLSISDANLIFNDFRTANFDMSFRDTGSKSYIEHALTNIALDR